MHSRFSLLTHATYCSSALHCTMDCSPLRILLGPESHLPGKCLQPFRSLHPTPHVSPVSILQILSVTAVSTAVPSRWKNLSGSGCSRRALTLCGAQPTHGLQERGPGSAASLAEVQTRHLGIRLQTEVNTGREKMSI